MGIDTIKAYDDFTMTCTSQGKPVAFTGKWFSIVPSGLIVHVTLSENEDDSDRSLVINSVADFVIRNPVTITQRKKEF